MTRRAQVILIGLATLAAVGLTIFLAAKSGGKAPDHLGDTQRITDMASRQVQVPKNPRRILSLCTSATATLVALGLGDRLAAVDEYGRVVDGAEHATVIGKGSMVSREQVLALGIDLAFVWWYQDDAAASLEGLGVPVVRIRSGRAAELPATIRLVGQCVGSGQTADEAAGHIEDFLRQATSAATGGPRPRVYLELYGAFKTVGRNTYMNDLLELAGATNVADAATGSVLLSAERLMQADPDVILFVEGFATTQAIIARPGMAELKAVKSGNVRALDRRWLIAGPNLPQAVDQLRAAIAAPAQSEKN